MEPMTTPEAAAVPVLANGDVMSREEFHRRYAACEGLERVELIEGVVYMPSPISIELHARQLKLIRQWLEAYERATPGVEAMDAGTVLLDDRNELIPDAMLYRLAPGRFRDGYLAGAPELVIEVASSSVSRDLHQKKAAYERNGVREYIVWRVRDDALDWFELLDGRYARREPDADQIIESSQFPGLRLDVSALLALDRARVLAALTAAAE
jgi:Uma2 family endonuclease